MSTTTGETRRKFIKNTGALAGSALLFHIVPSRVLGQGGPAPSDTINFGHIGIGGRGRRFLRPESYLDQRVTAPTNLGGDGTRILRPARSMALCDIDNSRLDQAATIVGGRPRLYKDFRELLDKAGAEFV